MRSKEKSSLLYEGLKVYRKLKVYKKAAENKMDKTENFYQALNNLEVEYKTIVHIIEILGLEIEFLNILESEV